MPEKMSAEEYGEIMRQLGPLDQEKISGYVLALEAELATSEAARERAENELRLRDELAANGGRTIEDARLHEKPSRMGRPSP